MTDTTPVTDDANKLDQLRDNIFSAERQGCDLLLGLDRVAEYAAAFRALTALRSIPEDGVERKRALEEAAKLADGRAEACRMAGVTEGIDPIEAQILDEHLSECAQAIRALSSSSDIPGEGDE